VVQNSDTIDPAAGSTIDVVVEIPRGSRNKYEMDHHTGVIRLDRRLFSATVYPADYGFIPDTLGEDGDPLDALVLLEDPTFPGCWVTARPVGVFWMEDEKGPDAKIICVPPDEPRWNGIDDLNQLPLHLLNEIEHFFDVYKMLEEDKSSATRGYEGKECAWEEIRRAQERYVPH
jgi:inorganic pyrophosphatase